MQVLRLAAGAVCGRPAGRRGHGRHLEPAARQRSRQPGACPAARLPPLQTAARCGPTHAADPDPLHAHARCCEAPRCTPPNTSGRRAAAPEHSRLGHPNMHRSRASATSRRWQSSCGTSSTCPSTAASPSRRWWRWRRAVGSPQHPPLKLMEPPLLFTADKDSSAGCAVLQGTSSSYAGCSFVTSRRRAPSP